MKNLISVILALIFPFVSQAGTIQDLIDKDSLILYINAESGHLLDLSNSNNTPTIVSTPYFTKEGLRLDGSTDYINMDVVVNDLSTTTAGTFAAWIKTSSATSSQEIISFGDTDGDTRIQFDIDSGLLRALVGITGATQWALDTDNVVFSNNIWTHVALVQDGASPVLYVDGVAVDQAFSDVTSKPKWFNDMGGLDNGRIGCGNWNGGGNLLFVPGTVGGAMLINRALTATEVAALYAELTSLVWPSKASGHAFGSYGEELLTDGNQEAVGVAAWTAADSVLSKETGNVLAGSQVLRVTATAQAGAQGPKAYQDILTIGKRYRTTGWTRSDGTEVPRVSNSTLVLWVGTNSTSWQYFDIVHVAVHGFCIWVFAITDPAGTEYVEFDNIEVVGVESDYTQFKTDWATHTSTANVTTGNLENTPFQVSTGEWRVSTDEINGETVKVIECMVAGILYVDARHFQVSSTLAAYGTWEWWFSKADASATKVHFISPDVAGSGGYRIGLTVSEHVELVETGVISLFQTVGGYVNDSQWYKYGVTRRQSDGLFTVYLDDVLVDVTGGSGANPVADPTTIISLFVVLDLDAGDKISLGSLNGDHSITKQHGVIRP